MAEFLFEEVKDNLRIKGYSIDATTTLRDIAELLFFTKKTITLEKVCSSINLPYRKSVHDGTNGPRRDIYLHFLDGDRNPLVFWSLKKGLGDVMKIEFSLLGYKKSLFERVVFFNGERAVLSFKNTLDREVDYSFCRLNKVNINLELVFRGFSIDNNISIKEIYKLLGKKMPKEKRMQTLCEILEIVYYPTIGNYKPNCAKKVLATSHVFLPIEFSSLKQASRYFEISSTSVISKIIEKNYPFSFWGVKYSKDLSKVDLAPFYFLF